MTAAVRSCPACATPLPEEAQFCLHCGASTPTPGGPPRTAATETGQVAKVRAALAAHYRIERVLGEGGMATVYLAEDLKHRRPVAIKVMRPELGATLGADRFLREVEIAAKLSHPHILPMHDSGAIGGFLYYVMPYVEGESLRDRLHREGQLPVAEAVRLAQEVAEALAYAHKRHIIHRDVKPANIMLGEGHALVADFGIARALGGEAALTGTGLAVGTPQYMSPEQAMGSADVDARADVYAVGGVLFEMLAGRAPYTGDTPQAILAKSLTEEVPPLRTVRPDVPAPVAAVVAKAMVRSPGGRYASAGELAAALGSALDTVNSGPRPVGTAGPSPAQVWGVFGASAAVTLGVVYGLVQRWGLPGWALGLAVGLLAIGVGVLVTTGRVEARRRAGKPTPVMGRWFTWRSATLGGGLAAVLWVAVALVLVFRGPVGSAAAGEKRLAVLPFENLGSAEDGYFADGVADEVRGKLLAVPGLQVIASGSANQYKNTTKSPAQIAQELGVQYLLVGKVRWDKRLGGASRVQVTTELVQVTSGSSTTKWQAPFDAALTDVFQVQADIAGRVAQALDVALGDSARQQLAAPPTQNLAAYDAFLRGEAAWQEGSATDPPSVRRAIAAYEQAVALDSGFVAVWARLARAHANLYFNSVPTPAEAEASRRAAERATALAPNRPESHWAWASYYGSVLGDNRRALAEDSAALALAPGSADFLASVAGAGEALGFWDQARAHLEQAARLDPRSPRIVGSLAYLLLLTRHYPEARAAYDRALVLAPTNLTNIESRAMVALAEGDLVGARAVLRGAPKDVDPAALVAYVALYQDLMWVLNDAQQALLLQLGPSAFDNDRTAWGLVRAQTYALRGDLARARLYADSARQTFEEQLHSTPNDPQRHVLMGLALAYLGRKTDAIREGERGVALDPIATDENNGPYYQHQLARIYILVNEPEKALDQLEPLLRMPYYLSPGWLKIDPTFAPLHGNPRFQKLLQGGS